MPTFVQGNMWDEIGKADCILVTSNASINTRNKLVMGRGAALEAVERFPHMPSKAAIIIHERGCVNGVYGVIPKIISMVGERHYDVGLFQVKFRWQDEAKLLLIAYSCGMLNVIAMRYTRVVMPFPGIGAGRLSRESVLPILKPLPDNVFIYEYPKVNI